MSKELIQQVINGDKKAFHKLYLTHKDKALRTAIAITRNREMAKDALQETFIRVFRNFSKYEPTHPFEPWLFRILINECNRLLKKESKFYQINQSGLEEEKLKLKPKDDYDDLYDAIQSLKDSYRIPILLKYIKGFSEKEISETLDLKVNTVKTRLYKGRIKLKKQIEIIERRNDDV
ncbi:RNA polymerase sigma factor [Salirhabdus salicampi]|uniref:RNA polymerase sigma factor n=1 Tax=Salirhabdus salicampi TaxID=476102 RepID=UPI0020C2D4D4|nr:sigma-70 family RNA polymerase sigma factor [Salirhabdus salicampi]